MPDAAEVGRKVLANLAAARAQRWPGHAERVSEIRRELDRDILAGKPARGRAVRISRRLHIPVSTVKRNLAALFRVGDLSLSNVSTTDSIKDPLHETR
jgi:hypothetical protein